MENVIRISDEALQVVETALATRQLQNGECERAENDGSSAMSSNRRMCITIGANATNNHWPRGSRAAVNADDITQVKALITRARKINHRHPQVIRDGVQIAEVHLTLAEEARDQRLIQREFDHLRVVIAADPTRSWVRKRIETLRDTRLGLNSP